jgi:hypothetical protein
MMERSYANPLRNRLKRILLVCFMVCIKEKRPERGVFIEALAETNPLPMFLAFPFLHDRLGFWLTMSSCVVITITCFVIFSFVVKQFGIDLI